MLNKITECTNIWIGSHAVDATAFDRIVPISTIFTCDYGSDVKQLEQVKSVFSWEKKIRQKHSWSNFHVNYLFHDELRDGFIDCIAKLNGVVNLLCYAPSGMLEKLLDSSSFKAQVNYCSISVEKKLLWDDKILFHPESTSSLSKLKITNGMNLAT